MLRVYRYRMNPTAAQDAALRWTLARLRELYNAALQERRGAYRLRGKSPSAYDQMRSLGEVRSLRTEYADIHTHLLQDAITRLDYAYRAFFRRVKAGKAPGFPRFKGRGQYHTFTFKDAANDRGAKLVSGGKRVRLAGIGNVKVRLHRPYQGTVKQVSVTLASDGHWYIAFVCDNVPAQPLPETGRDVGIDLGLNAFVATSDGEVISNPRHLQAAQRDIVKAQRRVSRRKKGSKRRRKAVAILAKKHARVANARRDFHHKVAVGLARTYDAIAIEDLNVKSLARGMLAGAVHDVGWGQFTTILASKAESAGRVLVKVNPAGTSQTCSACLGHVPKDLGVRVHRCPHCGFAEDRDINAALNIQRLGRSHRGEVSSGHP